MLKRKRLPFIALLLALSLLFIGRATPAFAHATVLKTDPADGSVLAETPRQIHLWVSSTVILDLTRMELTDGNGNKIFSPTPRVEWDEGVPVLVVDLPPLEPNAYRLSWQSRADGDFHVFAGSLVFGVQRPVVGVSSNTEATAPQPVEATFRWFNFMGLTGLLGSLTLALVLLPYRKGEEDVYRIRLRRKLLKLALWAAVVSLITEAGVIFVQGVADSSWELLLTKTSYGARFIAVEIITVIMGLCLLALLRLKHKRLLQYTLVPLTLVLVLVQPMNSHAAGEISVTFLNAIMDALHLLSASLWVGGLAGLAIIVTPLLRRQQAESRLAWQMLRQFGVLAASSIALLFITGIYKSGQQVASLDALLTTAYGQTLLAKIQLVLLAGLVGLLNAALLHPRLNQFIRKLLRRPLWWRPFAPRHLRRAIIVEAVCLAGVLLTVSILNVMAPARGPEFDPPALEAAVPVVTNQVNDLVFTLSVKPNRPGQNFLEIGVFNTRRPVPGPIEKVVVKLRAPGENSKELVLTPTPQGNGKYQIAGNQFDMVGNWNITVTASRPDLADLTMSTPWKLQPAQPVIRRPVIISNQPLAPILGLVALGLGVLLVVGVITYWVRFRFFRRTTFAAPEPLALEGVMQETSKV